MVKAVTFGTVVDDAYRAGGLIRRNRGKEVMPTRGIHRGWRRPCSAVVGEKVMLTSEFRHSVALPCGGGGGVYGFLQSS